MGTGTDAEGTAWAKALSTGTWLYRVGVTRRPMTYKGRSKGRQSEGSERSHDWGPIDGADTALGSRYHSMVLSRKQR